MTKYIVPVGGTNGDPSKMLGELMKLYREELDPREVDYMLPLVRPLLRPTGLDLKSPTGPKDSPST